MQNENIKRRIAASAAALALASAAWAGTTTTITGNDNFFQVAGSSSDPPVGSGSSVPITNWGVFGPGISYPELELREYFQPDGSFDQRVFLRVNLASVPAGSIVASAKLNLFWLDNNGDAPHSDYIDLWSVADRVEDGANFATSNGSTPWTDGFQTGVDGYLRAGPGGRHLGQIYHSAGAPAGTPGKNILDLAQQYKEFVSDAGALESYLTTQLTGSAEANFQISIGNDSAGWQRFISASDDGTFWPTATENPAFANQPFLQVTYLAAGSGVWAVDNDGAWSTPGSWQYNTPNALGAEAFFGSIITADRSVLVDGPQTVGAISFDNAHQYSVGGSTITLDTASGPAAVNVLSGGHQLSAPLQLNKDTTFTVAAGSSLTVDSDMAAAGVVVTKAGAGPLQVKNIRASGLTINAGTVAVLPSGTAAATSTVATLNLNSGTASTASLDLTNNAMVVDHGGTSPLATLLGQIQSAYNGGAWTGNGIKTTAGGNYGVGYAEASELGSIPAIFGAVDDSAVLLRGTIYGDANLDGIVDIGDFSLLAANFNQTGPWSRGDFNYDGMADIGDFSLLATNFNQSVATSPARATVPEPAVLSLLVLGGLCSRRRR